MSAPRLWSSYHPGYRAREMRIIAEWVLDGASGAVVGLAGAGKSNLLGFLCYYPGALQPYLSPYAKSAVLIPVDLNNLPANDLATFYRVILRSFQEVRHQFDAELQAAIHRLYLDNRSAQDPFLPQSAVRELLYLFQANEFRVVLVMDRFDTFCRTAAPEMTDTLRGLRDSFKDTLCYVACLRQEVSYLSDPEVLGELYEVLDTHVCWVGPMNEMDARQLIAQEIDVETNPIDENTIGDLVKLTGGYPSLLKAACHWYRTTPNRPPSDWVEALLAEQSVRHRLGEIWQGLSQAEQLALSKVEEWHGSLSKKGLLQQFEAGWQICGDLLAAYVAAVEGHGRGAIWLDEKTAILYQGQTSLKDLTPLEDALLRFLVRHPRARHTYTELIEAVWSDEANTAGVSTEALYQVVRGLRRKIEPTPSRPRYIVNWRGKPEGGYQAFPEGRPD